MRLIESGAALDELAAPLRARTGIKTPDAIHAAAGLSAKVQLFLTNDSGFTRVPDLKVALLSRYV